MALRNDISINWDVSPRIITVNSPSVEITMQDLYDTLRDRETIQIDEQRIIAGAGKEPLGGGVLVGLTLTLNNALLAFEARPGPTYTQCNVSGGNLVAVDSNGDALDSPIYPTAFTQIVLANSSSATLQEIDAIQYASFNGGVTIDVTSSYTGTTFPIGTLQQPVNNLSDAYTIAVYRGFRRFFLISDLVIDEVIPNLDDYTFIGRGMDRTHIQIDDIANTNNCEYLDSHTAGTLDGDSRLEGCFIDNLNYIKGFIESCVLSAGVITLGGNETAHFLDCWSGVPGSGTPIIDLGGAGQSLALRGYNGGIKLRNKTGIESVSIDLNSGQAVLENTVINGEIVCRGVGKLIDINGDDIPTGIWNGATIINETINGPITAEVNTESIANAVWNEDLSTYTTANTAGNIVWITIKKIVNKLIPYFYAN